MLRLLALCLAYMATLVPAQAQDALEPGGLVVIGWPQEVPQTLGDQVVEFLTATPTAPVEPKKAEPEQPRDPRPMLAIVIDDYGPNMQVASEIFALGEGIQHFTHALMPGYRATGPIAQVLQNRGLCHIVHLPMQAIVDKEGSKEYLIGLDTPSSKIDALVRDLRARFPAAWGVNNHRGSKATADPRVMTDFMTVMSKLGWNFLDSRTSSKSVAVAKAKELGVTALTNTGFIDGKTNTAYHKEQFQRALQRAKRKGSAIVICHARSTTLPFLRWVVNNPPKDVRLVTLEELASATTKE